MATRLPTQMSVAAASERGRWRIGDTKAVALNGVTAGAGSVILAYAYGRARDGSPQQWPYWLGEGLIFAAAIVAGVAPRSPSRRALQTSLAIFGIGTYLSRYLYSPDRLRFWDELQHWRAVQNAASTGRVGAPNITLPIEQHFPGLQAIAVVVRQTMGVTTDQAGMIVALASHLALVLAIFATYERFGASARVAFIGTLIYASNQGFLGIAEMFVYETLALPFCVAVIYFARDPHFERRKVLTLTSGIACAAVVIISHHLTALFMVGVTLLLAVDDYVRCRARFRHITAPLAAAATIGTAVWFLSDKDQLANYVRPYTATILSRPRIVSGATLHGSPLVAATQPTFDYVIQRISLLIIFWGVAAGALSLIHGRGRTRPAPPVAVLAAVFALSVPLSIYGGKLGEVTNRLAPFLFLGVGLTVAMSIKRFRFGIRRRAFHVTSVALLATCIYLGGVASSFPTFWGRLPGSFLLYGFDRGVDQHELAAADWAAAAIKPGSVFAADGDGAHVIGPIADMAVAYNASSLFYLADLHANAAAIIKANHVNYIWVDRRMLTAPAPYGRLFSGDDGARFLRRPTARDLDELLDLRFASIKYDDGTIAIMAVDRGTAEP